MEKDKQLLQEWRLERSVPTDFNAGVWRRIERARAINVPTLISEWLTQLFARPAMAVAYVSLSLLLGLGIAQAHANRDVRTAEVELKSRYIQAVDPYAMPVIP